MEYTLTRPISPTIPELLAVFCRNLRNGKDVGVSMSDYIHKAQLENAIAETIQNNLDEDKHEQKRDQNEILLKSLAHKQGRGQEPEQEQGMDQELKQEPVPESEQEYRRKRERKVERKRQRRGRSTSKHEEEHIFPEQQPPQDKNALPSPRSPAKTPEEDPFYYAKDVSCPTPWKNHLNGVLPNWLSYMNDNDLLGECNGK